MPKINLAGFGPYDIRGIYPEAVNEELFYRVGRVCPSLFGMKKVAVSVAQDEAVLEKGVKITGATVHFVSSVLPSYPSPMFSHLLFQVCLQKGGKSISFPA